MSKRDTQVDDASVTSDTDDTIIGALIADRYRVSRRLGVGGIGRVYLATQEPLGRQVALKLLHPELGQRKDIIRRFEREAQSASRLSHPGSVTVYDFGTWNGQLYLAMEFVDGPSLADVIERDFPLASTRVVDFAMQICDALEAAHSQGLLHRDLKPENILIAKTNDGREQVKVCDYGLAYLVGEDTKGTQRLTKEGTVAGTPTFMSPEQILSKPLDRRSDVYALGCVIYEILAGVPPFMGETAIEVLTKHLYDAPDPPSKRTRFSIPRELEQVVMWPLQKAPANRPQSASELKAALMRSADPASRWSSRPSGSTDVPFLDRDRRADMAGMATTPSRVTTDTPPVSHTVLVVEPADTAFEQSASLLLRAQGSLVRVVSALEDPGVAEAVVVDVRRAPMAGVVEVGRRLPELMGKAVLVIGTDDAFDAMTKALELQIAEYVPESALGSLPRKLHRAVERARRSQRGG